MANAVLDSETGELLEYRGLLKSPKYREDWNISSNNEFGILAQGIGNRTRNPINTIFFISKDEVSQDRFKDSAYGKFVCYVCPQKAEPNQTQHLTVDGNRINVVSQSDAEQCGFNNEYKVHVHRHRQILFEHTFATCYATNI